MSEQLKLRTKFERDLMTVDQKIERQQEIGRAVNAALIDLHGARRALLAAMAPVQEAAE